MDEFSELLAQRPELIDLLVTIGRIGRSLGLHLLLASQRLDEGRMRGLESHLSYRIALRTFSAAESRAVLGVPDAHRLAAPGSAFLAAGSDELVRFQATFVSAPAAAARRAGPIGPATASGAAARPWPGTAPPDRPARSPTRRPADPPAGSGRSPRSRRSGRRVEAPTVLRTMIAAMAGLGPPAHRVWLPPLDLPPPLDEVLGPPAPDPDRGLAAPGRPPLCVPYGLVDRPLEQRREVLVHDLTGPAGHLAVVGGPQSGKSAALCTLVLGLALTSTPTELGVHVLDFGGGALAAVAGLPHVGTVADGQQPDLVRRLVGELTAALARRERLFRAAAVTSIAEFRARRAAGEFGDEPATDLLLVVDGYLTLRGDFDDLEARLLPVAAKGLSYGLHLAVSANRWSELRPALRDLLGQRIELRLGDPLESEVDRRLAAAVPARPGHGLAADGSPMVLAAPRTGEPGSTPFGLAAAIAAAWPGPAFAPVRLLPERVDLDRAARRRRRPGSRAGSRSESTSGWSGSTTTSPLSRTCSASATPSAARRRCCGCSRTASAPATPRIRPGSWPSTSAARCSARSRKSHLIGHTSTAESTADAMREIAESLRRRLPGPAVSARALRERSWWTGPELYLLVDDYDLVAPVGGAAHPLAPLVEFLAQAKDVGLHVVVARRCGGAARALFDPLLGRLRELGAATVIMNGSPDEGPLDRGGPARRAASGARDPRRPAPRGPPGPAGLARPTAGRSRDRGADEGRGAGRRAHRAGGRRRGRRRSVAGRRASRAPDVAPAAGRAVRVGAARSSWSCTRPAGRRRGWPRRPGSWPAWPGGSARCRCRSPRPGQGRPRSSTSGTPGPR